ncbi:immunoglobulin I-set domain protein [Ancylostoma duodenale]|uniref:Immunoglobulin I-set domain protein n=1 Tax=Ancylostoma duodenale TaxID=51022 RepID=A0A0C2FLU0_9BILA|nr:immunoglobulin I-set domain protein [Ancylostoma duodenale]
MPGAIEIVRGLEDTSVAKGQKVVLAIETSAAPKQIKWYKNGKELSPSDKAKPEKIADNKYQLAIPDADKEDTADYKVNRGGITFLQSVDPCRISHSIFLAFTFERQRRQRNQYTLP